MPGSFRKTRIVLRSRFCAYRGQPGCQLLEATTSVRCRFLGSSQESNALDRVSTLHGFWFDVSGFECPLWVKS
jgi:hypothetical protein